MKFLATLVGGLMFCSIASARSYAYDDPTLPSMPDAPSKQPSRQKTKPSTPVLSSPPSSILTIRNGDNPLVKNGMPCIEEICLHDEPQDLDLIVWKGEQAGVQKRSFVEAIMLGDRILAVDNVGLRSLSQIKGACQALPTFSGSYTTKNGDNVSVRFQSVVSPDGTRQKYIVTRIERGIKGSNSLNNQQIEDLDSQTMQKYPAHYYNIYKSSKLDFPAGSVRLLAGGTGDASLQFNSPAVTSHFHKFKDGFTLSKFTNPQIFYNFPGCGSERKIKL